MEKISRNRSLSPRGFTLIELLVVVAIIALLATILFPAFARVRENARRASCQSNLKQIGIGIMMYVQDYDETMPFTDFGPGTGCVQQDASTLSSGGGLYKWMDAIFPYVKSEQVFVCPSADSKITKYIYGNGNNYGSYAANSLYTYTQATPGNYPAFLTPFASTCNYAAVPATMSQIVTPAETVSVLDRAYGSANNYSYHIWQIFCGRPTDTACFSIGADPDTSTGGAREMYLGSTYTGAIAERHLGTTSVLWCDGHVKAMSLDKLMTPGTSIAGTAHSLKYFTASDD